MRHKLALKANYLGESFQHIANYSALQKNAAAAGDVGTADCLGEKISQMRALPNFWSRNLGVDPALTINDANMSAQNCQQAPSTQRSQMISEQPPTRPITITEPAPIAGSSSMGEMSGTTLALVGVTGAVAVGLGAVLLLSKKSDKNTPVSGAP